MIFDKTYLFCIVLKKKGLLFLMKGAAKEILYQKYAKANKKGRVGGGLLHFGFWEE